MIYPPIIKQSSQLVTQGATVNVTGSAASGETGTYQWLGAFMNSSSAFSANTGNQLCGDTAQSLICTFQTVSGYNSLSSGTYYLKLRVTGSEMQGANSSVVFVNVRLNEAGMPSSSDYSTTINDNGYG